jgi:hypothetical protein
MTMDDDRMVMLLRSSALGRVASSGVQLLGRAWMTSRLNRLITSSLRDRASAVRVTGVVLMVGSVTHAAIIRMLPTGTAGRVPLATSAVLTIVGLVAALAPGPVVSAWGCSLLRRLLTPMSGTAEPQAPWATPRQQR